MSSRPSCDNCGEYATLSGCEGGTGGVCKYLPVFKREETQWFVEVSVAGMTQYEVVEACNTDHAESEARQCCISFAESYGYYQDLDYFGDLDQVYREDSWCEEEEAYQDTSSLDYYAKPYVASRHEHYL